MKVEFIHINDKRTIKEVNDNIFIPTEGDMLVVNGVDYLVTQRTMDYDENIITIYVDG